MFSDISYRLLRCVKHMTMQHCIIHCTWSTDNNAVCRKFRWQATNAFYRVLSAVFISHAILTFLKRVTVRRTNQCWFLTENERCCWRGFADSVGRKRHDEHSIISGFSSSSSSSCRRNKLREYRTCVSDQLTGSQLFTPSPYAQWRRRRIVPGDNVSVRPNDKI